MSLRDILRDRLGDGVGEEEFIAQGGVNKPSRIRIGAFYSEIKINVGLRSFCSRKIQQVLFKRSEMKEK